MHVWCEQEVCGHVLQPVTSVPFSFCWSALLPLGKNGSSRQWGARLKGERKGSSPRVSKGPGGQVEHSLL